MIEAKTGRGPGRPKNTGRRREKDALLLPLIADKRLVNQHQSLAAIIRELIDAQRDTGGVRRLQRAFKAQGENLMDAAKRRRQQQQIQEFTEKRQRFSEGLRCVANTFADRYEAWANSKEGQKAQEVMRRFAAASNSPEMKKWREFSNQRLFEKMLIK